MILIDAVLLALDKQFRSHQFFSLFAFDLGVLVLSMVMIDDGDTTQNITTVCDGVDNST